MALFSHAVNIVDIQQGLELGPECSAKLTRLRHGPPMIGRVTDGQKVWEFTYSNTYSGGPPKFKFTTGWLELAGQKNLKPGNKVSFYDNAEKTTKVPYIIEVRR